jgi:hypothetical protein
MNKNIKFYVQPPVIVLTAAHYLEKEPGCYLEIIKQLIVIKVYVISCLKQSRLMISDALCDHGLCYQLL